MTGDERAEFKDTQKLKHLVEKIDELFQKDAKHFSNGDFPISLLKPRSPLAHTKSLLDVLVDSFFVARRMKDNKTKDFNSKIEDQVKDSPDYFQRNFHFQSEGYFSRSSAKRYDHQVDILFGGTTNAMRRQAFVPLLHLKNDKFKALELGCGQGGSTTQFHQLFPKAHLIATDFSSAYLSEAKDRLKNTSNVDFVQMDASKISFKDNEFDLVFHSYLFHELPMKVRKQVMAESFRVLKPQGRLIVADSLQLGDDPEADWALSEFPKRYHEPFYTNYIKSPLAQLFKDLNFQDISESHHFLTKSVIGLKSLAPH